MAEPVKGKSEAGRRREERARQRRERIVGSALRLFLAHGYAATTIEAIARDAGVAPATVYQAFGTKQAILAKVLDVSVAGDAGPAALLDREWVQEARRHPDPRTRLAIVVRNAAAVAARSAPVKEIMRDAAATEPAVRQLLREDDSRRYRTQQALVDLAIGTGSLREGCDRAHAVASFYAVVSSYSYLLLTQQLGWDRGEWQRWLLRVLDHELFGAEESPAPGQ